MFLLFALIFKLNRKSFVTFLQIKHTETTFALAHTIVYGQDNVTNFDYRPNKEGCTMNEALFTFQKVVSTKCRKTIYKLFSLECVIDILSKSILPMNFTVDTIHRTWNLYRMLHT